MRLVDLTLAFPRLVLAIAVAGTLGVGLPSVAIAIVVVSWAWYARLVRGMVLQVREEEYVLAARALGAATPHVISRHLLPALGGRVAVLVSLDFGTLILNVSALSFLGLGVQPPTAEWGAMLNEGRLYFAQAPELMLYPGLAIFFTVLAANLLGDALRDALDPRRPKPSHRTPKSFFDGTSTPNHHGQGCQHRGRIAPGVSGPNRTRAGAAGAGRP
jgi:ABC-type dipeptide/oligopeptide/nickel transport system permease subunit